MFRELKDRGLSDVAYVVSDNHRGLVEAIHRHFQGANWQRCQVHFIRNALGKVPKKDRKRVLALLREITGASCLESAQNRLREAVDTLAETHPKVADMLDQHGEEMLAVYALPEHHRKRMRTTNMVERLNEEFRRRTRVIRVFPNETACVRITAALAIEINEEWMERKHLDMNPQEYETGKCLLQAPTALQNIVLLHHSMQGAPAGRT